MPDSSTSSFDEGRLLDELIEKHGLYRHRESILDSVRPGVRLQTHEAAEDDIPLGATKIGGRPDLPAGTEWPVFWNAPHLLNAPRPAKWGDAGEWPPFYLCKPLAFLAQINLTEIARVGRPIRGLPASGLLSLFSTWGWCMDQPNFFDFPWVDDDQDDCTIAVVAPARATLKRVVTPDHVNTFRAAAVESISILTLPEHRQILAGEGSRPAPFSDDEIDRYVDFATEFRSLQNEHWHGDSYALRAYHQLGGYFEISQGVYPEKLTDWGLANFLQIASDSNVDMMWGDLGELSFFADADALTQGRFERIWGLFECG